MIRNQELRRYTIGSIIDRSLRLSDLGQVNNIDFGFHGERLVWYFDITMDIYCFDQKTNEFWSNMVMMEFFFFLCESFWSSLKFFFPLYVSMCCDKQIYLSLGFVSFKGMFMTCEDFASSWKKLCSQYYALCIQNTYIQWVVLRWYG